MPRRASRRRRSPTPISRVENNLEIVPVINKIDLPGAQPDEVKRQIEEIIGLDASGAMLASAKTGSGVHEILEAVVASAAAAGRRPRGAAQGADLRLLVRPLSRRRHPHARHRRRDAAGAEDPADGRPARTTRSSSSGCSRRSRCRSTTLGAGEAGFLTANIKTIADAQDRRHHHRRRPPGDDAVSRLQGIEADGLRRPVSRSKAEVCRAARRARASCG